MKTVWLFFSALGLLCALGETAVIIHYYDTIAVNLYETLIRLIYLFIGCFMFTLGISEALSDE